MKTWQIGALLIELDLYAWGLGIAVDFDFKIIAADIGPIHLELGLAAFVKGRGI